MLSKETAIVLPALLAGYALLLTPQGRRRAALRRTWPFWAVALLYALIRLVAMEEAGASGGAADPTLRAAIAAKTVWRYVGLLLLPHPLAIEYRVDFPASWAAAEAILCVLAMLGLLALLGLGARRFPAAVFSTAWLLIALLPSANLVVVGPRMVADQRLYLPSVGYSMAFSLLLAVPVRRASRLWLLSVFALLAALTTQRDAVWKDGLTFWRDAVAKSPQNAAHRVNLGQTLGRLGQSQRAEQEICRAVRMNPKLARPYVHLAGICLERGEVEQAADHARKAVEHATPADPFTRAEAHAVLARIHEMKGRSDDALREFELALKADPEMANAHAGRGVALDRLGRPEEALAAYERAIALDPALVWPRGQLGAAYERMGRLAEALAEYKLALGLGRDEDARIHSAIGDILRRSGALEQAAAEYEMALLANPRYAPAHINLGNVHLSWQRPELAVQSYRRALEIDPKLLQAHFNLGIALLSLRRTAEAAAMFEKCLEIAPDFAPAREQLRKLEIVR
ncbi:MAG: tetratricopeptide repeat protein [Planctomycetes bacterium]|nr:tetratricopeptide repeat protein [Planctomycetota bacterium]